MQQAQNQLLTARAWAAMVLVAALSIICFYALSLAEQRLTPWAHRRKDP
jgi:NitT/TauT family transport system permease protein/putative hydroxymethylpyrimidine transport system permease protein